MVGTAAAGSLMSERLMMRLKKKRATPCDAKQLRGVGKNFVCSLGLCNSPDFRVCYTDKFRDPFVVLS